MPNKSRRYFLRLTDEAKLNIINSKDSLVECAKRHNVAPQTVSSYRNRANRDPAFRRDIEEKCEVKSAPPNRFYRPFQDGTYAT